MSLPPLTLAPLSLNLRSRFRKLARESVALHENIIPPLRRIGIHASAGGLRQRPGSRSPTDAASC
ncbi:hypothetical protein CUJ84_pRLN5000090 (plasmid) [Rhizobium leguminosarum]|uniref:Uncharacterized protein n=1 Tax=Rhizobium leguminosarum TaxID=384 RepID=A0A2K9ZIL3_RHILE|nr:hypothetical protein CUJ84_pRLN5000090 [Rhizobium leguminosarum]